MIPLYLLIDLFFCFLFFVLVFYFILFIFIETNHIRSSLERNDTGTHTGA